jgi:hypothetical protein
MEITMAGERRIAASKAAVLKLEAHTVQHPYIAEYFRGFSSGLMDLLDTIITLL